MTAKSTAAPQAWLIPATEGLELFRAIGIRHSYARHAHAGYAIGVIEAGVGGNVYRGSAYLAPPQSIVLMNPDEAHTGYAAENLPLTYRMLYLSRSLLAELSSRPALSFRDPVVQDRALAAGIQQLHHLLELPSSDLERQTRLIEVLTAAVDRYADAAPLPELGQERQKVRQIKAYLHDNLSADISLDQLVALTQLDRSYLIRLFRQAVGLPPYAYLTQIRIEAAKRRLARGEAIADVAIAVGMADQSHLTRHFKSIVGTTPGRYQAMSTSFKTRSR